MMHRMVFACMGISLAALCVPAMVQVPVRLVYNPSDSVARGWYRIEPSESPHVGSIVLVRPLSEAAKAWIEENVALEGWQWFGGAFACEPRMVEALLDGIVADGFAVG